MIIFEKKRKMEYIEELKESVSESQYFDICVMEDEYFQQLELENMIEKEKSR